MLVLTSKLLALIWAVLTSSAAESASVAKKPENSLNSLRPTQPPKQVLQTEVTKYFLPSDHRRCLKSGSRLSYIDHSLLIGTQQPDDSILDAFILCDSSFTWAAVSSNSDEIGGSFAWRLAFRINSAPNCGDSLVLNSSEYSPLAHHQHWHINMASESVEFNCANRVYPYLHKSKYRFSRMSWRRANLSQPSTMTISVLVYARYRRALSRKDRIEACQIYNGFWCGPQSLNSSGGRCIYSNHYCNGFDDCMDAADASQSVANGTAMEQLPSDEIACNSHQHDFNLAKRAATSRSITLCLILAALFLPLNISKHLILNCDKDIFIKI